MTIETYLSAVGLGAFSMIITALLVAVTAVSLSYIHRTAKSLMRPRKQKDGSMTFPVLSLPKRKEMR